MSSGGEGVWLTHTECVCVLCSNVRAWKQSRLWLTAGNTTTLKRIVYCVFLVQTLVIFFLWLNIGFYLNIPSSLKRQYYVNCFKLKLLVFFQLVYTGQIMTYSCVVSLLSHLSYGLLSPLQIYSRFVVLLHSFSFHMIGLSSPLWRV